MRIDEYTREDGLGLARLIARKEVSALEVMDAALAACAAVNPEINAVVEVYDDARDVSKLRPGPFHGVPYLMKDVGASISRAARRSRVAGSVPAQSLPKTITSPNSFMPRASICSAAPMCRNFPWRYAPAISCYGTTSNPWKKGYSTSGSSGGAAAAVAAGIVPVAHASDMGGSITWPRRLVRYRRPAAVARARVVRSP